MRLVVVLAFLVLFGCKEQPNCTIEDLPYHLSEDEFLEYALGCSISTLRPTLVLRELYRGATCLYNAR